MRRALSALAPALSIALCAGARAQAPSDLAPLSYQQVLPGVQVTGEAARSFSSRNVQVGAFRDQDPLDVPLTNNVVTREVLDAQGARTLYGALRNTAGVTRSQLSGATYDNISIRGILVENRGNYRLNGSLPIVNLIDTPLENKQRVEVLKGASSLYYGLVPPSGVVNFVTKRAGDDPVTSVAASLNDHGAVDVHADIGRRFAGDRMGLRVNAAAGREDIGIDNYKGERALAALAWDWRVAPALNVKLDLEHYRKNVSEPPAIALLPAEGGVIALPPVPDNRLNLGGQWQRYDAHADNVLLRTDVLLSDDWIVTLETGRAVTERDRRFSQFQGYDLASGEGTLRIFFSDGNRFENTNHRIETTGRFRTGALAHEVSVGYTHNKREGFSGNTAPIENAAQNLYAPRFLEPRDPPRSTPGSDSQILDKGLYLFDRINFGPRWQLLAGLRRADYSNTTATSRFAAKETSPNLSLLHKLTPSLSLYASYLEGLEETGTAPLIRANSGEILPPAINKQREPGVKARVGGSALLQAAYFTIERPATTIDAANRFVLGGRNEYRGVEGSASGEIGRHFAAVASMQYLDAEIASVGASNAGELGMTPENTPRTTASLFGEYRLPQLAGLALNAGVFYVGKRAVNNLNQPFVPGYSTVSLGARYATRLAGAAATWQVNIDNATDKSAFSTAGNGLLGVSLPRTVRLAAKFDL